MNRKIIAVLLLLALTVSLTACGTASTSQATEATETEAPSAEPTTNEAAAAESTTNEAAEASQPEVTESATAPASGSAETATISAENKALIEDTMQAIYDVQPGSSGCSLRTMIAAGKLLDLAETLTDQVDASELCQVAYDWAQNNDNIEGAFDEAYLDVRESAFGYLDNPEQYEGLLQDCGYVFTHETHTRAYLEYVTNYIEISRATGE